jgi:hypothetical protein
VNTRVPTAIRAIHDAIAAHVPNALVIVGPGASDDPGVSGLVLVGVDDADEVSYSHAVTGSQTWAQLGGGMRDETFSVHCVAVSWNGDDDALAAMDGAFALMGGIETAITSDPTLTGAVLFVKGITAMGLRFTTDSNGVAAHVPFDVECRTRI